jgi:hypothetical protein
MKRLRKHPRFLLVLALTLPLVVALLYYQFYDENDLVVGKYYTKAEESDLLTFLRKNPKVFIAADGLFQSADVILFEIKSFHHTKPASTSQTSSVLRC